MGLHVNCVLTTRSWNMMPNLIFILWTKVPWSTFSRRFCLLLTGSIYMYKVRNMTAFQIARTCQQPSCQVAHRNNKLRTLLVERGLVVPGHVVYEEEKDLCGWTVNNWKRDSYHMEDVIDPYSIGLMYDTFFVTYSPGRTIFGLATKTICR